MPRHYTAHVDLKKYFPHLYEQLRVRLPPRRGGDGDPPLGVVVDHAVVVVPKHVSEKERRKSSRVVRLGLFTAFENIRIW